MFMGYTEIPDDTDGNQQKVSSGHGGYRERAATALGLGKEQSRWTLN